MESKLGLAIAIAAQAFKYKVDKGGSPYILHCLRVMNKVNGDDDVKCAAVLHDIIEDTNYTFSDLINMGFTHKTCSLVNILTHDPEKDYNEYIQNIVSFPDAREIKLRDLEDNMNFTRLNELTKHDIERLEKYHKAYITLFFY